MKKTVFTMVLLLNGIVSFAQSQSVMNVSIQEPIHEKCSQHERMQELMVNDPLRFATMNIGSSESYKTHYTPATEKTTGLVYTIPVVFHVLHNNGAENISEAQILDALAIMNRDFRRQNADADNVDPVFIGMPSDVEVNFVLATVAPNSACFNGITRTVSTLTNNGSDGQAQIQAIVNGNNVFQGVWPHNRYLNIYVCNDIGGAAGYTFLPNGGSTASVTNMYYNGIFVLEDYTGSIGTSSVNSSRTLTHEVGHWLNLPHVWGAGNTPGDLANCGQDDGVQDTPNCAGVSSCNLNSNTCNSDDAYWGTAMKDNVENYMDYSYCSKMYTQGQVDKMRLALTSSVGGRSNIWTTSNLNLVGGGPGTSLCAIDFSANQTTMCAGTTVTYTPNTTTGISAYNWSFPGGTPTSSTLQSPTVTYSTVGTHNASLTVTSSSTGTTYPKSKTAYITVNTNTTVSLPISEGFVAATYPPTGWTIVNAGGSTWVRSATVGRAPTAGNSMLFDNFNINETTDDEVRLPKANMTGFSTAQMTFDVAYAPYNTTSFDGLEVLVSTNCGGTFTSVYSKSNTVLATAPATTGQFTPTAAQWRTETIDLTSYVGQTSVWIAIRNLSGYGNRLFVDNVNVSGVTGTPTPVASFSATGTSVCAGGSVTYTSTSTNSPTSYSWSFPGGSPSSSTVANPTVTYPTAGTYNVVLTATNAGGSNTITQTNYVTVNAVPATPIVTNGGPYTVGQTVQLNTPAVSGATYSWAGCAGFSSSLQNPTVSSSSIPCNCAFSLIVTVNGCASSPSTPTNVVVNTPTPTISAGGSTTFCSGGSVVLTSSASSGNTWSTGATTQSITVSSSGTYTVSATSGSACSAASSATTVTVNPTPAITTGTLTNPSTCSASDGSIAVNGSATGNLSWTGTTSGSQTGITLPTTIPSLGAGNYTITFTSTGCTSNSLSSTLTGPGAPTAPTISASGSTTFCSGGSVVLTSSSASGNTWSTGATTQSITVTSGGSYTVSYVSGGCTSATSTTTSVTVTPNVTPTFNSIPSYCVGATAATLSTSSTNSITGTWSPSTISTSTAGSTTYTFTPTAGQCATTTTLSVTVNPSPTVTLGAFNEVCEYTPTFSLSGGSPSGGGYLIDGVLSSVFNPQAEGIGTAVITYSYTDVNGCNNTAQSSIVVDACLGVEEATSTNWIVYPNPSSGVLTVQFSQSATAIRVLNQIGQLVIAIPIQIGENSKTVDLNQFANGMYTIELFGNDFVGKQQVVVNK